MSQLQRYLISIMGSGVVGLGVGLCVKTGFGADALGVLWEGVSDRLSVTVGQASLIVTVLFLSVVVLVNKKELGLATVLNPLTTSMLTDLVIRRIELPNQLGILLLVLLLGISLIGIGSGIAAATNTGKEGYIALSFALSERFQCDLARVRIGLDLLCFSVGMILGGKFMLGPILGILLIGPLLKASSRYCEDHYFLSSKEEEAD